ncbi:MAG: glycosyltransferase family 2 protein, partial [Prevotella sp.]|nr:glycosyltransferase family 2 protein [Prevotella sp.]
MKVLAIIVSYNFKPWADKCLGSLVHSELPCDIMVIDNGSTDGTADYLRHYMAEEQQAKIIFRENGANLGFGRANNIGIDYALEQHYDAVLLLNQDAWLQPDTLGRLCDVSRRHADFGIVSPVHTTRHFDKPERGFGDYSSLADLEQQPDAEIVELPFIDAAIWLLPLTAVRRVGMFAPLFYHYGEDKDLVNRMHWHGLKVGYVPHCYGCHDREDRQPTRFAFFRAERTYHLSQYANVNLSFIRAFALGPLAIMKKA